MCWCEKRKKRDWTMMLFRFFKLASKQIDCWTGLAGLIPKPLARNSGTHNRAPASTQAMQPTKSFLCSIQNSVQSKVSSPLSRNCLTDRKVPGNSLGLSRGGTQ